MKRFTEYLNEDFDPAIFNADGSISITDPTVMDAINSNLEVSTSCSFRTPYNALEEIRKMLAYYKIFLPKSMFLDQNHGNDVFEVSQFGNKMGMNNQGEVVTASDSPLFVYFEWSLNEKGMYEVFAALVNQEELDEILADYDAEVESDEDLQEQHSMGKASKMLYKVVNQVKSQKQRDDVDSYIEHEKQGKTFTQVNEASSEKLSKYLDKVNKLNRKELKARGQSPTIAADKVMKKYGSKTKNVKVAATEEVMPDLKKKMGAKKVSLSNMMRKEETLEEKAKWRKGKPANPVSVNPRNDVLKPVPGKKMRSGIGTWLDDGKKKTPVQGYANEPDRKGKMAGPRKGAVLPEETVNEIADTPKGKEAVRLAIHRADATAVDSAINPPRSKKGKREAKNAMKTIDRGIAVHKKKGGVLDNYLKRSYGIKESEDKPPFEPTEKPSTPYKNKAAKAKQLARAAMEQIKKGKEEKKRLRKSLREK